MSLRITAALLGLLVALSALGAPPALAQKGGLAPIISGHYLLGGVENGQWLDAATTLTRPTGSERYRIYTPTGYVGASRAGAPDTPFYCHDTAVITLTPKPKPAAFVAVGGTWQPMPRPTRIYSNNSSVYCKAIADLLRTRGITNPDVRLTQIIRVDLEGDGVDEVLISATRLSTNNPSVEAGDYSLVVLRKIIDGKVATIQLEANYYPQAEDFIAPNTYSIAGILDLNGDAIMDVVVNTGYYEGAGAGVFQINGGTVNKVLSGVCGV